MPGVDENLRNWAETWDWSEAGEEWSQWWGGTSALWYGALLPRLHAFLPAASVLEIAPGYGRWTSYLKEQAGHLAIVDLTEKCIGHCRERFSDSPNISYHVNDGRSLAMIEDDSVDFVFSFDSLVHAEPEVLAVYLEQLAKKLTPNGVGFIHHSNAGSLKTASALTGHMPDRYLAALVRRGIAVNLPAWRDPEMTAKRFRADCARAGLACITQELVSWEYGPYLIDCFSFFTRQGSRWDRPLQLIRNPAFVSEGKRMRTLYADGSFSRG
jgi:SAM-dependent methyltransferase